MIDISHTITDGFFDVELKIPRHFRGNEELKLREYMRPFMEDYIFHQEGSIQIMVDNMYPYVFRKIRIPFTKKSPEEKYRECLDYFLFD